MFPVYGLAEACLAVTFPQTNADYRWIRVNRHKLGVGATIELNPSDARDALELMCVGRVVPNTDLRIVDDSRAQLPPGRVGHILISGPSVTRGYFGDAQATALAIDAEGWVDTGDLGVLLESELYIAGRSKEIIFVNGQNYYPYDLENIAQRAPGLDLNKVVAAGVAKDAQGEALVIFVLHRGSMREFLAVAASVSRLVNEHTGLEVAQVIPTKRIPKTTSGKVQRHLLEQAYIDGEFDAELKELESLRQAQGGAAQVSGTELETRLQSICEAALPGKRIDVHDNLFDIGASSLKLIEIHEHVDRDFPGLIDLTELFDHPTIAELAKHLEGKLKASHTAAF
jgi:acyl-CoA synthetase (AMP-forming)/AMP-acid ligase II/aryl carrier-like protein